MTWPFWTRTEPKRLGSESYRRLVKTRGIFPRQCTRLDRFSLDPILSHLFRSLEIVELHLMNISAAVYFCTLSMHWQNSIFLLLVATVICLLAQAMLENTALDENSRQPNPKWDFFPSLSVGKCALQFLTYKQNKLGRDDHHLRRHLCVAFISARRCSCDFSVCTWSIRFT